VTDIILHHYPMSPYAEKVRIALGIKRLAWRSVYIPVIMPKPDLMPLTGGYRKTPVMQIGADIFCDTQCILRELERRFPEPSLYRGTSLGLAEAFAFWSERALFQPAIAVALAGRPDVLPEGFLEDRAQMSGRDLSIERMRAIAPMMLDQLRAQLGWYESMLSDGRAFLFGEDPTLVDCAAYHPCWFLAQNIGFAAAPLAELPNVRAWLERVAALGHGMPTNLSARDALSIAAAAQPATQTARDEHDPLGRKPGDRVSVTPDDTGRDPVVGELVSSSTDEIVIRRLDAQVGEVHVHFPRAGFVVKPERHPDGS
jgi:glutathione S-transferase